MTLTGIPFLVLLVVFAVAVMATTMVLWNRWPGWGALPLRVLSLLLVMLSGVLLSADLVNREFGFYTSFGDLTGRATPPAAAADLVPTPAPRIPTGPREQGLIVRDRLPGPRARVVRDAIVYLPAAYFDPAQPTRRFPVIELFHGRPGGPHNWERHLHMAHALDTEIAAGRMRPVIVVATTDDDGPHDQECVDAVRGVQDETYLAVDVPAALTQHFRVMEQPRSWAGLGYSTGGFCAVNIALHHPDRYAAAGSLSGYFRAVVDADTGDLYRGRQDVRHWNSPQWLIAHRPAGPALYLVASRQDRAAHRAMLDLRRAAGPRRPDVVTVTPPTGGHNFRAWAQAAPGAFDWLADRLPQPAPGTAGAP
ncbi:alpha/beta hydrolase [Embleya scabrispora]|uniref:alpha/beta hydrolase n=1 Tax=Embleya scabrispora TaxID=159449 RepID=UPI0003723B94|nr:alpha/beta hydrolase-fold protein [Embleya scabrispora]MYS82524.1 esterase [Streptomyces sp. SID5474]